MKKIYLIKTLLLLCALVAGSGSVWAVDYEKVTSVAGLESGSKYLLVYEGESPQALGAISNTSTKYGTGVSVTISNNKITINSEAVAVLTLEASTNNSWKFKSSLDNNYLHWSSGNSLATDATGSAWTVTYNEEIVSIKHAGTPERQIKWNTGSPRFACYTSGQSAVALYKEVSTDNRLVTTTTVNVPDNFNPNIYANTTGGTLTATVTAGNTAVSGANIAWSSSNEDVATISSNGVVTLVATGVTTITASYAGDQTYKPSSAEYELTVIYGDPDAITIWSEDFSLYSADDVPEGGKYGYSCTDGGGTTKIYANTNAGGESPELLVAKSNGTFKAVVPLKNASGTLVLTYKQNANSLSVSTSTEGISGDGSFNTSGEHTVYFTGVNSSMSSITIVFTSTSTSNVRLDDIVLKGRAEVVKGDVVFNIGDSKTMIYGDTYTVTNGVSSENDVQTDGAVSLSTSNENIVSANGMTITANAAGTATITITASESDTYKAGSKTVTFTVTAPEGQTTAPEIPSLFKETFDKCEGSGGRDNIVSGSVGISSTSGKLDESWSSIGNNGANHCIKLGTGSAAGTVTTSNIALTGNGTLTFSAAGWGDTKTNTINVSASGATLSGDTEVELVASTWNNYIVNITEATGSVAITFSMQRGFLDDVKVVAEGAAPAITATLNAYGYATFCSQYPLDFTNAEADGYSAWQITSINDDNTITFEQITGKVKGGTGIFLKGTAGETIELISADSETVLSGNKLMGTLAPTYVAANEYYGLSGNNFVKVNAGTVPTGKALIPASLITATDNARPFTFIFADEATGISEVEHGVLNADENVYDLQGRRVVKAQKGLYIVNGKKVMVK